MTSTYQLLAKAERLELLAERLYEVLAGRFGGQAKELFQRLAREEAQHAARIRLLAARYRQDRKLVAGLSPDATLLDRLLLEAEEAVVAAGAGAWDGDPQAALHAAAELERHFSQAHAQALSQEAHPGMRAFFEQLAEQDRAHEELLEVDLPKA
jgi:rubrerythrin